MKKIIFLTIAIIYTLSPIDLVSDFIVGPGWIDDLALWAFMGWYFFSSGKRQKEKEKYYERSRARADGFTDGSQQDRNRFSDGSRNTAPGQIDPYRVLGVLPDATEQEIKSAYRRLVNTYHPDKVAHMGGEFIDMAEIRFKEIQEAWNMLKQKNNHT